MINVSEGHKKITHTIPRSVTARAALILGGLNVRDRDQIGPMEWIHKIREGFPFSTVDSLGRNINATNAELAQILGISAQTLASRRRRGRLSHYESERLFRAANVIARAENVFGSLVKAIGWLKAENLSLSGLTPISLLDTEPGVELITVLLRRIEYGICA